MENYIKKYFELIEKNLNYHLNNPQFTLEEKEKISIRLELINELKTNISWQFKSTESKQASRIQHLATLRKIDAMPKFIRKQELTINIYEKIKLTFPYLEAINSILNDEIIEFVNNLCENIDLSGYSYEKEFPKSNETRKVFKSFFEVTKSAQGNSVMFRECYEKIESLYNELIKLSEIN
ncbi:hypothetical protein [Flavobacterium sp. 245]|uniref:hypothetical protein n=1 Tax=Flavobacterium sp. 245 TaxID=2512115 RepID=UPI00105DAFFA|nr:hypothetical protein [Flavobacterium sp. 245]TDO94891.1 hypothetical protein EV145_11615 [Flavobacterium sp. 245]